MMPMKDLWEVVGSRPRPSAVAQSPGVSIASFEPATAQSMVQATSSSQGPVGQPRLRPSQYSTTQAAAKAAK